MGRGVMSNGNFVTVILDHPAKVLLKKLTELIFSSILCKK